ncbi:G-type lectin S-receptor-like serine/threonine-protein kinase At1g11300 [Silene latifolia]|uniref:G-type lectin S-receptor-like serine/threonine-protein kinase At1g11300 n=1 Tax=Silene latifolia TaxID=37657 RepID=UPI003D786B7F
MKMLWAFTLLIYACLTLPIPISATNISVTELLKDPNTIVSTNGTYKLGFFSPPNTKNRYLGIWYNNVSPTYYVWVANRNNPLKDSSGLLMISEKLILQVVNGNKHVLWSPNIPPPKSNHSNVTNTTIDFLVNGNLIYRSTNNGKILWQSFEDPTDSLLPNMQVAMSSNNLQRLYAWKTPYDPSIGRPYSRLRGYSIHKNDSGYSVTLVYTGAINLTCSHYVFNYNGSLSEVYWDPGSKSWVTIYQDPIDECDFYRKSGEFGICNSQSSPICRCLKGFVPQNPGEWNRGNWSSGCVRRTPLQCGKGSTQDGFLLMDTVKLPDLEEWLSVLNQNDCRNQCLENCSCTAYAYDVGAGCMYWSKHLIDIQEFSSGGINLYLRLASSELRK